MARLLLPVSELGLFAGLREVCTRNIFISCSKATFTYPRGTFYLGLLLYLDYVMLLGDLDCQHIVNFHMNMSVTHGCTLL